MRSTRLREQSPTTSRSSQLRGHVHDAAPLVARTCWPTRPPRMRSPGGGPFQRQRVSLRQMATSAARELTRTDVLSTSEVAELLGIPRSTVHELARRGDLPARRVGRRWIFLRDRLAAAITPLDDPAAWRPGNDA